VDEQTIEVFVTLGWVQAGPPGWLLLHRRTRRATGGCHEYWRSNGITALDLLTLRHHAPQATRWRALLEGLRVEQITIPARPDVRLHLLAGASAADRRAATQRQAAWRVADHLALAVPARGAIEVAVPVVDGLRPDRCVDPLNPPCQASAGTRHRGPISVGLHLMRDGSVPVDP
jgi:hypothetical protein